MIHDDGRSNYSNNRPFQDIFKARFSRRSMLQKSMMLSAAGFIGAIAGNSVLKPSTAATQVAQRRTSPLLGFNAVTLAQGNGPVPSISSDYQYQVLIPWGTPIQPGGPEYNGDPNTRPTADEQAQQIGIGHDGMWFFPLGNNNDHGLLAINHEFGINEHVLGKADPASLEDVRLSQHAHGASVVEIKKNNRGVWEVVRSNYARRIHANTPMAFSGPAANHPLLKTAAGNAPKGTINNCSNGYTPWGTYLTCEENFNTYFGATGEWTPTEAQARYGLASSSRYGWANYDERFDLSKAAYKNEENRFGWVVEIDPMDPNQTPVKRTALGRFKHEGAEIVVGRGGRVVCYMGDDERFDYIYKFVSANNWQSMRARGISPFDEGQLYVAKFNDDGSGEWLPLSMDNPALQGKFQDQAEILVYARLAADAAGATPMDRPEWITVGTEENVYCALTNNSRRTEADAPNPLAPNPDGHIIRWQDSDRHVGTTFTWDIFAIAQDTHGTEESFASPDGLWADPDGRLFIQTDGAQKDGLNDQLLVADTNTKEIRRLFTGVTDCEVTGITVTPERRTMFINVQHPGDGNPATTNFPAPQGSGMVPRDSTVVITRKDGGIVGS
ncbi:PhoX family protein [Picosynechococcus sp. PCC 8807]|uniref:PhoX family protein n=1 Tax=Picosynechococcus sp. PCC 8807 TaxID=195248 RepID=UPI000810ECCE|nr:PhoX family phosphatase [Picosynechococcus sp. PCC 8807]ANV89960.1 phosphatase [Picosynechococcus sp. PCC 8807]